MELNLVGKSVPRIDALKKVAGKATYINDMVLPGMLVGKILQSRFPHAILKAVDTGKARSVPGVKAVITAASLPETLMGVFIKDMPVLARKKVRFQGEPVAAVAAVDENVAEHALSLIQVEYEELPAIFDPEEAMKPGASLIHEEVESYFASFAARRKGNVCSHTSFRWGDVNRGFQEANYLFEDQFETPSVHQGYLEPPGVLAQVDVDGKVTVWASTQCPHLCQLRVSEGLLIPEHKIRVVAAQLGGGFGGKEDLFFLSIAIALAREAGKPVKMVLSREEDLCLMRPRHPCRIKVKSGVKKDGALTARQVSLVFNTGAYADQGPGTVNAGAQRAAGPYRVPHCAIDAYCVYTNQLISGAYRGFGNPQASFALESHMDMIAEKLNLDPLELRLKNAVEEGDEEADGKPFGSVGLKECLLKVAEASAWKEPSRTPHTAKGVAVVAHISGTLSTGAYVRINQDGTVLLSTGSVDLGTGSDTMLAQMVAEELSLPLEDISLVTGDTEATPYNWSTAASRTTYVCGNAVILAASDAKAQLFELAASQLEANPEDMVSRDRRVFVKGSPDKGLAFRQLGILSCWRKGGPIIGKSSYIVPAHPADPERVQGQALGAHAPPNFGAHVVEVQVDPETGNVTVLNLWAAHDCGKAINPNNVEGQVEGAFGQGLGFALFEKLELKNGKVLNPNLADYKLPTALDLPNARVIIVEALEDSGPFGAKGVGEGGLVPLAPAIANAIYRAVGVRLKALPLSGEPLLAALRAKGSP